MSDVIKLCKDCRHFVQSHSMCNSPGLINYVTGVREREDCEDLRKPDGRCGPEGKLYAPRAIVGQIKGSEL